MQVSSNGDGTFSVGYNLYISGMYNVSVMIGSQHAQGSPYVARITAAEIDTSNCEAEGQGLETAKAGKEASFTIRAKVRNQRDGPLHPSHLRPAPHLFGGGRR